ncbi:rod-binding protein [Aliiroseovarius sp. KMU-50]|uniref:Rod-binding protein n=1 Tax=Aliiroseovarius salicola TaxID=3009082 RepID=A0ABT4W3P4_9RHOB|nr:rod-binding protein [Aliiroseovarius sp. KMU-50]MDA5095106.1 rod-binding protein [Aliiroseovarius sp. KMU-50]
MDPSLPQFGPLRSKANVPDSPQKAQHQEDALRQAAKNLEATFLAEMLKVAGVGKSRESFGGGAGEDQFSSFLVQAQAKEMVNAGGIGLAESLFEALKERSNGNL